MVEPVIPDPHATTRDAFRTAFREYTNESAHLQNLLLALSKEPPEVRLPAIEAQQKRVDEARERYYSTRDQYMRDVLGVIASGGGSGLF